MQMRQYASGTRPARLRSVQAICWIGVAVDAAATIGLALPARSRLRRAIFPAVTASQAEYAAGARSAAPLMAGWTVLLAWVAGNPADRSLPLLLTSAPVIAGLIAAETADMRQGRTSALRQAPTIALQFALLAMFGRAYHDSRRLAAAPADSSASASP
jgi:hypothetical protein